MNIDLTHPEILTIEQLQKVKKPEELLFFFCYEKNQSNISISLLDLV